MLSGLQHPTHFLPGTCTTPLGLPSGGSLPALGAGLHQGLLWLMACEEEIEQRLQAGVVGTPALAVKPKPRRVRSLRRGDAGSRVKCPAWAA